MNRQDGTSSDDQIDQGEEEFEVQDDDGLGETDEEQDDTAAEDSEGTEEETENQTEETESLDEELNLKVGELEFKTKKELEGYLKAVQQTIGKQAKEVGDYRKQERDRAAILAEKAAADDKFDDEVAQLIHEDPKRAVKMIREQVRKETISEVKADDQDKQFWSGFFAENKGLAGQEERVKRFTYQFLAAELDNIPPSQHAAFIKQECQKVFGKFDTDEGEPLSNKRSTSGRGGSAGAAPKKKPAAAEKNVTPVAIRKRLSYFSND
ncbi:MAG: hypothetical protein E6R03_04745 [Hyphomicrobiaceae bacterium]|nr:MAG: hypothetical protein E6R03_04745 [Hyphomicrobiaceae bacterium]